MRKTLLLISFSAITTLASAQCTELFFSEYLEGSSNNKAIEIYNPTNSALNLANYTIYRYNNGSPTPTDSLHPQGMIAAGGVYVAGNPSAVAGILAVSDTLHTITFYNGDDAMALKNNTTGLLVDIIGIVGVDPGTNWPVGTGATSEFTLVRMSSVNQGNTVWASAATEYDVYPQNTLTFIGNHTMTPCCGPVSAQLTSATDLTCYADSSGSATVTASGTGLTYSWAPYGGTAATATGLLAGTYTCIVADACSNADTVTVTLTQPPYLDTINVTHIPAQCNGDSNGVITIFGSGGVAPYTYLWSTGDTTNSVSGLAAGMYTYTITDANGCTRSHLTGMYEPPVLTSTFTTVSPSCYGIPDGSITALTSGGNSNCTFLWSTNQTTQTILNLTVGTYSCTATDINGCTTSFSVTLTQPSQLTVAVDSLVQPSACGLTDGSVSITPAGGTPGFSYQWSNSATTEDLSGVGAGVYSCVVSDTNGCSSSFSVLVTDPNAPAVTLSLPDTFLCQLPAAYVLNGESPAGGTWIGPGVSGNIFDPSMANPGFNVITYSYVDSAGCTGFAQDSIEVIICMSMQEISTNPVAVFPNPAAEEITIQSAETGFTYRLYDALGNEVYAMTNAGATVKLDASSFANGVYILRATNGETSFTERIVINR